MDLAKKVRFSISQSDIDLGIPRKSWACAVAMALRDVFPTLEVSVVPHLEGHQVLLYQMQGNIQPEEMLVARYELSNNASKWVRRFDRGKTPVAPATFEMTLIQ